MKQINNLLKLMVFMLAAILSIGFVSCGGDNDEDNPNPNPEQPTVTYSPFGVWELWGQVL